MVTERGIPLATATALCAAIAATVGWPAKANLLAVQAIGICEEAADKSDVTVALGNLGFRAPVSGDADAVFDLTVKVGYHLTSGISTPPEDFADAQATSVEMYEDAKTNLSSLLRFPLTSTDFGDPLVSSDKDVWVEIYAQEDTRADGELVECQITATPCDALTAIAQDVPRMIEPDVSIYDPAWVDDRFAPDRAETGGVMSAAILNPEMFERHYGDPLAATLRLYVRNRPAGTDN
ncbi:MAG: hypothetical protein AAFQ79_11105 [Pseudomonadota bacterium]